MTFFRRHQLRPSPADRLSSTDLSDGVLLSLDVKNNWNCNRLSQQVYLNKLLKIDTLLVSAFGKSLDFLGKSSPKTGLEFLNKVPCGAAHRGYR